jgi:hypothetical protein
VRSAIIRQGPAGSGIDLALMFGVVRDGRWNRPLVGLNGQRTRLELFGHVVVRARWLV